MLDPKVRGTWNLHNALLGADLDFFLLFSSLIGIFGQPTQANYAAANTFLDSFVQYRHSLNLPCSVLDIGVMDGIGWVSQRPGMLKTYGLSNMYMLQEQELMDAIHVSINNSLTHSLSQTSPRNGYTSMSQLAIGLGSTKSLSNPNNMNPLKLDVRTSVYYQLESGTEKVTDTNERRLREFMDLVASNPEILVTEPGTLELITLEVRRTLCVFLLLPEENIDSTTMLEAMGVDSLVSVEIRYWCRRMIRSDVTVLEIMDAGSIDGLSRLLLTKLKEKYGINEGIAEAKENEDDDEDGGADTRECAADRGMENITNNGGMEVPDVAALSQKYEEERVKKPCPDGNTQNADLQ